jgi:hypothetical protein
MEITVAPTLKKEYDNYTFWHYIATIHVASERILSVMLVKMYKFKSFVEDGINFIIIDWFYVKRQLYSCLSNSA